jgi:hypothetical protein
MCSGIIYIWFRVLGFAGLGILPSREREEQLAVDLPYYLFPSLAAAARPRQSKHVANSSPRVFLQPHANQLDPLLLRYLNWA